MRQHTDCRVWYLSILLCTKVTQTSSVIRCMMFPQHLQPSAWRGNLPTNRQSVVCVKSMVPLPTNAALEASYKWMHLTPTLAATVCTQKWQWETAPQRGSLCLALPVMSSKPSLRGRKTSVTKLTNINNNDRQCEAQQRHISSISTLEHVKGNSFETPSIQGFVWVFFSLSLYQSDLQISSLWQAVNFSQRNLLNELREFKYHKTQKNLNIRQILKQCATRHSLHLQKKYKIFYHLVKSLKQK